LLRERERVDELMSVFEDHPTSPHIVDGCNYIRCCYFVLIIVCVVGAVAVVVVVVVLLFLIVVVITLMQYQDVEIVCHSRKI